MKALKALKAICLVLYIPIICIAVAVRYIRDIKLTGKPEGYPPSVKTKASAPYMSPYMPGLIVAPKDRYYN